MSVIGFTAICNKSKRFIASLWSDIRSSDKKLTKSLVRMPSGHLIKSFPSKENYLICSYDKRLAFMVKRDDLRKDGDYIEFAIIHQYRYRIFDIGDVFKDEISKRHNQVISGKQALEYFTFENFGGKELRRKV